MGTPLRYRCEFLRSVEQDSFPSDSDWERAPWTPNFVDILGDTGPTPRFETRAQMLWSKDHFWVRAWLEEPCVWATLTEHDSVIFHDNDFEVFIDPDGVALNYFEFEVNAFGTTWDLFLAKPYRDGGSADNSWETDALVRVKVEGKINDPTSEDRGWWVKIGFPWGCFASKAGTKSPPEPGDVWRVNFSRVQWQIDVIDGHFVKRPNTPEDNWVWSPQGVVDMHQPEQWGFVEFCL